MPQQEFPRATAAELAGQTISLYGPRQVSAAALPKGAAERLLLLRERADSVQSATTALGGKIGRQHGAHSG
jgi:hypothetical protein